MIVVEAEIIDLPYACQPGDKFPMKEFMDFFNSTGPIPASPVRREMTGQKSDELKKMLEQPVPGEPVARSEQAMPEPKLSDAA